MLPAPWPSAAQRSWQPNREAGLACVSRRGSSSRCNERRHIRFLIVLPLSSAKQVLLPDRAAMTGESWLATSSAGGLHRNATVRRLDATDPSTHCILRCAVFGSLFFSPWQSRVTRLQARGRCRLVPMRRRLRSTIVARNRRRHPTNLSIPRKSTASWAKPVAPHPPWLPRFRCS